MTSPSLPHPVSRPRRAGAVVATVVATLGLLATSIVATPADEGAPSAAHSTAETAMVDMLAGGTVSTPMTLGQVRSAIAAFLDPGLDGSGVDVALIDTGVAPVEGLDGKGKVLHGPDLSVEGKYPEAAYLDTYGHGTHMAGIIAGERVGHAGIAPGARIISIKAAGRDGATSVAQVVAAIDWVVEHRNTDGLDIRVLNLSLGQADVDDHVGDYLSAAVERAWDAGIFVVVAAGNRGETQKHLDSPAVDPYVLAVGAHDLFADAPIEVEQLDKTTTEVDPVTMVEPPKTAGETMLGDDDAVKMNSVEIAEPVLAGEVELTVGPGGVPSWSAQGDGSRNPDMIAAGKSIASYRVPGSTADEAAPEARFGDDLFLGSGTSQAAAVTSGMAAVILQKRPKLTPDELKAMMSGTAFDLAAPADRDGHGVLRGNVALTAEVKGAKQNHPRAAGPGTGIDWPKGATWSGGSWSGGSWSGASWSGTAWSGGSWSGGSWSGASWSGASWSGGSWSGGSWSGGSWSGGSWSGGSWSGGSWSGGSWSGSGWQ